MPRVQVLGSAAVDTVVSVDVFPGTDMIVPAQEVLRLPGGSAANIAVALSRLGVSAGFLGVAGDDADGALIADAFAGEGVDASGLLRLPGARTASVFIAVNGRGERVMYALGGESLYTEPAQLDRTALDAELLYIGEAFTDVGLCAADRIHASGGRVCFGPGGVMCGYGLSELRPLIAASDLMFVSRPELRLLTERDDVSEGASVLMQAGASAVVVTEGADGASYHTETERVFEPCAKVTAVTDTTGAGDAFTAAFLAATLDGLEPRLRLRFANRCAAYAIQRKGARTSPRRSDLEEE